jgi:hypothetical protein
MTLRAKLKLAEAVVQGDTWDAKVNRAGSIWPQEKKPR